MSRHLRSFSAGLKSEKLEWGNSDHLEKILQNHPEGFDLILGADIYILIFANSSIMLAALHSFSHVCVCAQTKN